MSVYPARTKAPKKERRSQQKQAQTVQNQLNFTLNEIRPLTENQQRTFAAYRNQKNLVCHGMAGTGKTFISMYLALSQIMSEESKYKKLCIVRSVVPTRDVGFLPGSNADKIKIYEAPYQAICTELFGRCDAYEYLKKKGIIEFVSTSFLRGTTFNDCIIIADECQNYDWQELTTTITRTGQNCRLIFSGDYRQSDLRFKERASREDIKDFMKVLKAMHRDFEFIEFERSLEIVNKNSIKYFKFEI